jgi:uncharacterized protein (TIGR02217 family)
MVASSITVDAIYLDARRRSYVLTNSSGTLEDNTSVVTLDSGLVVTNERWGRVKHLWSLSWSVDSGYIETLYKVNRSARGFLFISPRDSECVHTGQLLRNTVTGLNTGDGSTTTFQLQVIDSTTAHSVTRDVNYPLSGTQTDITGASFSSVFTAYKNGVSATATVSTTTGIVTFSTAPGNGVVPTADFLEARPVLFSSKSLSTTWLEADQVEVRSAQIEEIF